MAKTGIYFLKPKVDANPSAWESWTLARIVVRAEDEQLARDFVKHIPHLWNGPVREEPPCPYLSKHLASCELVGIAVDQGAAAVLIAFDNGTAISPSVKRM